MFNISDYLKKFTTIGVQEKILIETLGKEIQEKTGTPKENLQISIKGAVVYIDTDRSTKNLIFLFKGDILDSIAKHNLRKKITDIR